MTGTLPLQEIARAHGGEVRNGGVLAPGPGHSKSDRSLSVKLSASAPDGFVVHSFAGDDPITCKDHVRERLGLPGFKASKSREPARRDNEKLRIELALHVWRESTALIGTRGEFYLTNERKLTLDEGFSHVLRFHPRCPFGPAGATEYAPAMIALMRDVLTDQPRAVQRIRLTGDGKKVCRMMLGTPKGAAIKLDPDENVILGLAVTEGCETGLAARQLGYRPVWALGRAGGIESFPVLSGIEGLTIHAEPGDASLKAVHECGRRWREAGRDVVVLNSLSGSDLNDAIRERAGT
jgi:putative DNA primase/helicase